jgi:pseudouridylate synthase I
MRIKCVISYDGSGFQGYQIQKNARTVQAEIESVLARMHKGKRIPITAAGRTDTGVHALGQVIHFDTTLNLPDDTWIQALNAQLPKDIAVMEAEAVPEGFHARYSAKGKEYRYRVLLTPVRNPLLRHYAYHFPYPVDVGRMKEAAGYLLGTHDFTSFSASGSSVRNKIRTIYRFEILQEGKELWFVVSGNGFLYNMVRIMVGTLLEIGTGKREPEDIPKILSVKDRKSAGKTAPGHGLYLYQVFY